jgi:phospholipase/carboxylesterase
MRRMLAFAVSMQTLGTLKARVIDKEPNQTVERVVVILHGFGAPGDDLVPLVQALPMQKGTRYVFPEAPIDLGDGRAWWIIDWNERARYERSGDWTGYTQLVPPGLPEASDKVSALLDAIEKWGVPSERVVLGGFSQGAMLALDVAAHRVKKPRAIVCLSGSLIAVPRWLGKAPTLKGVPILMTHGKSDPVLPFAMAERLRDELNKAGARVEWTPFSGGHQIPDPALAALRRFLEAQLHASDAR